MSMWMIFFGAEELVRHRNHPVVKAGSDGNQHVAVLHGEVGFIGAVHAEHADKLAIGGRIAPNPIRVLVTGAFR